MKGGYVLPGKSKRRAAKGKKRANTRRLSELIKRLQSNKKTRSRSKRRQSRRI